MSTPKNHQTSLNDLSDQIHAVYRHLLEDSNLAESSISLGSTDNEDSAHHTPKLKNAFISSHLSPYNGEELSSVARSAPATPLSVSSTEYIASRSHFKAITDPSVDVIADSLTPEPSYPPYSPYSDDRKLNQTYSLADANEVLDATPDASSSALDVSASGAGEGEDWTERGAAETIKSGPDGPTVVRRTVKDFEFGKDLGEGSYSTVVLATDKITKKQYAVKVLDKRHIIKEKKVKYVNIEKHALNRLTGLNGIISLFFTFQDKDSLYFVLDFASNGELLGLIKTYGSLNEECTRHFGAQILGAIKNMHDNGIVHRDIKPENILLDDQFRIRITDFGTAKLLERKVNDESGETEEYPVDVRAKSFVGTAEYVSPELLENKYCGKPGDIWAFGCILYQLIAGKPPFKATNEYLTFQKITKLQYAFSAGFPLILRDLIKLILVLRPSRRAAIPQIQKHPFFEKVNFTDPDAIWTAKVPEFGPYKMNAQSMMKMPPKAATPTGHPTNTRKDQKTVKKKPASAKLPPIDTTTKVVRKSEENGSRNFTPASVAAYVLAKDDESPSTPEPLAHQKLGTQTLAPKQANTPEYIPGTNILRPQVNTMANFSRGSSGSSKSDADSRKHKPRSKELPPATAIEAAWQQYLSPDERIIHVGSASASKKTTEAFERKHKGLIHDTPLGFNNQLKNAMQRSNSRSMLSRYVRENQLKDLKDNNHAEVESDAITFFYEEVINTPQHVHEDDDKDKNSRHGRFGLSLKKLLVNSDKKVDNNVETIYENGTVTRQTVSLEKPRMCTVLITTYGRVLLFLRDDVQSDYKLICEVRLQYPFINFKEVVTSPSTKFGKHIPATGIFAITSKIITFVFEVEKYEVNQWTEALARSKLSLVEREATYQPRLAPLPKLGQLPKVENLPKLVQLPKVIQLPKSATPRSPSTHDLMESPRISTRTVSNGMASDQLSQRQTKSAGAIQGGVGSPRTLDPKISSPGNHLLAQKRIRAKEALKRKAPPPPLKSQNLSVTGLLKDPENGEKATVHAAQLAVSSINVSPSTHPRDNHRTSSFTKETPRLHKNLHSAVSGGTVTPMNSKLLARSRGGK